MSNLALCDRHKKVVEEILKGYNEQLKGYCLRPRIFSHPYIDTVEPIEEAGPSEPRDSDYVSMEFCFGSIKFLFLFNL